MDSDEPNQQNTSRRKYLIGAAATGGAFVVGGSIMASSNAQNGQPDGPAEFCGEFTGGPQPQQCISCVEDECEGEEVFPLYPLYTGLSGQCFEPDEIPDGAEYVTLKAGQNCYLAPVSEGETEFCLPEGSPDISNATFYRCGGDPTQEIVEKTVTCDAITITTENIDDGTTLTATVTFVDAEGVESEQTIDATVENDEATFTLPGDLNPVFVVITLDGTVLDEQEIEADDAPCFDAPDNGDNGDDEKDKKKKKDDVDVKIDGICYKEDKGQGQFRIENHEKHDVTMMWKVLGTSRSGSVTVPKRSTETVWVHMDTDQKLGLYYDGDKVAEAEVNTTAC